MDTKSPSQSDVETTQTQRPSNACNMQQHFRIPKKLDVTEKQSSVTVKQAPQDCIQIVPAWTWFLLAILAGMGLQRIVPLSVLPQQSGSQVGWPLVGWLVVGWLVVGLGMAVLAWSERQFARNKTSHDHRAVTSTLITTGPFRFSRNPAYVGLLIVLVGLATCLNTLWILLFAPLVLPVIRFYVVPREEACLERLFPDTYPAYRRSVRRWL